jgi:hypothetical protein
VWRLRSREKGFVVKDEGRKKNGSNMPLSWRRNTRDAVRMQ